MRKSLTKLAMIGTAMAGSLLMGTGQAMAQEDVAMNNGNVAVEAGADITTAYYFRGIIQEDQGFIFQPWIDLSFTVFSAEDGPVTGVVVGGGVWSSLHSEQTGDTGDGNANFYETDVYFYVAADFLDVLSGGVTYTVYTAPNGAFATVQELAIDLGFDDSSLWEGLGIDGFGLAPYVVVAFELENTAFGADEGTYFEIGFGPEVTILENEKYPVTLAVPFTFGFGSDYYETATEDEGFGYFSVGAVASVPLSFIPAEFGEWGASAGITLLVLGDSTSDANTDGDDTEIIGTFGFGMAY